MTRTTKRCDKCGASIGELIESCDEYGMRRIWLCKDRCATWEQIAKDTGRSQHIVAEQERNRKVQ
jgi:hypothetical protein